MEIGIVGLGVVGNALYQVFKGRFQNIKRYDPDKGHYDKLNDVDIIFICINDKNKDMKLTREVVKEVTRKNGKAIIVLRTTVLPGTTDSLILEHKRTIVFMPEFLTEKNALKDMKTPDKIIIGTENNDAFIILLKIMIDTVDCNYFIKVKPIEAELAKLAMNSIATIKVVFAEEMYDLSNALGADYNNVYKIMGTDKSINRRHLMANKNGYRGAGGKCLPKDIGFLNYAGEKSYTDLPLVKLTEQLNIHYLMMKD